MIHSDADARLSKYAVACEWMATIRPQSRHPIQVRIWHTFFDDIRPAHFLYCATDSESTAISGTAVL